MTYRIYFDLTGCFEIEANSEDEALEKFDDIEDYSNFVDNTYVYNVFVEESR